MIVLFIPAFCLKIIAGIAYGWVYVVYYGGIGDSLNFYKDAGILADFAYQHPFKYSEVVFFNTFYPIDSFHTGDLWLQPRAFIIIKWLSFLSLITHHDYWLIGFYLSFFSFWGLWSLVNQLIIAFPHTKKSAAIGFLFLPSVIFWSAGLSKESLVMATLGFTLSRLIPYFKAHQASKSKFVIDLLVWVTGVIILWLIKFYYLAALIPCILTFFLTKAIFQKIPITTKFPTNLIIFIVIFLFIVSIGTTLVPGLALKTIMVSIVTNHNVTYIFSKSEDLIHFTIVPPRGYITISPHLSSLLYNSPQALFSALFRPFLWETGGNKLKLLLAIENFFILTLSVYALCSYLYQSIKNHAISTSNHTLIWTTLLYISILLTLLAFASPNFGSLARYKVAALPFLFYLISIDFLNQIEHFLIKLFPGIKKFLFWL